MTDTIRDIFEDSIQTKRQFIADDNAVASVADAATELVNCYQRGGKVIVFGNGGSAADSQHMAAELVVRFEKERKTLPCIALNANSSIITAAANDYSFDVTFSRQVEALASENDVIFAISTSGNSKNVIEAVKTAKQKGVFVIVLTGKDGGQLRGLSDIAITVKSQNTARIQETHGAIIHILCKIVEDSLSDGQ